MRKLSQVGLSLIKSFEGCRLTAYNATGKEQYLTIGWGHYGADVKPGMTITQEQADNMLMNDLEKYVAYVNNPSYVPITNQLNQNQFDALVSFCYNCGAGNLKNLCENRTAEQIAKSLPLYNKGGGVVLAGLVRRRAAELELFNKPEEVLYTVYQGKANLGSFATYADAVEEAKKWANSYVAKISDGSWVWTNIPKEEESEDDSPMKMESWQKSLIISEVTKWSKVVIDGEPVINSPQVWIDKVNNGTLTAGELSTLTFAIVSRAVKK